MNIALGNAPDSIYRTLKREAEMKGRGFNAEIIHAPARSAAEAKRRRR